MARTTQTLSVRIDPEVLKDLIEYTRKNRGVTQAKVVENLIRYFNQQSPEQQYLLVRGVGTDYLDLFGEALQLVTWGDHAVQGYKDSRGNQAARGSFLPWVIETYNKLDEISASAEEINTLNKREVSQDLVGILSLRRIAWFKLGTAWIFVARELRTQALIDLADRPGDSALTNAITPSEYKALYDAAIDSLRVASANFRLFNKSLEKFGKKPHPTVLYNQACTWSLIAQYISERNANDQERELLAQATLQEEGEKGKEAAGQPSEKCVPTSGILEAENALRKANEYLQNITIVYQEDTEGMPFADAQWLFDYAERDPDIACFRKEQEDDFKMWLHKKTARISLLDSYRRLRDRLPKDVAEVIAAESSDIKMKMT